MFIMLFFIQLYGIFKLNYYRFNGFPKNILYIYYNKYIKYFLEYIY